MADKRMGNIILNNNFVGSLLRLEIWYTLYEDNSIKTNGSLFNKKVYPQSVYISVTDFHGVG